MADVPGSAPPHPGLLQRFWRYLFGETQAKPTPSGVAGTTRLVIQILWIILAAGLLIELAYGLSLPRGRGWFFVSWAWIASLSAALAGGFFGVLFGLPSLPMRNPTTRVEAPPATAPSQTPAAPAAAPDGPAAAGTTSIQTATARVEQELPYNDSTSLEQIADWLTKIIVGLALTQYQDWSAGFASLSRGLTIRLLGPDAGCTLPASARPAGLAAYCDQSAIVPGGVIILAFATAGFLGAYFWMRRYFIIEMIVGQQDAKTVMQAKITAELEEQRLRASEAETARLKIELEDARVREAHAKEAVTAAKTFGNAQRKITAMPFETDPVAVAEGILAAADGVVPQDPRALQALARVRTGRPTTTHPDDPWQGRFGGRAEVDGVQLLAGVLPLPGSQFFELDLEVRASTPDRAAALTGATVVYFLHPTFGERPRSVSFGADGRAPLQLYAYGAFTVGALLEDGTTLELNLATIPDAPDLFRSR